MQIPLFESEFLENVARAFRKRRKALSHRTTRADYAKVYDVKGTERHERLEIYLDELRLRGALLRLHAWQNRWIWLDARRGTKTGWAWSWSLEGRLLGECSGQNVIEALEETHDLLYQMDSSRTPELSEPWKKLLGRGPLEVHKGGKG